MSILYRYIVCAYCCCSIYWKYLFDKKKKKTNDLWLVTLSARSYVCSTSYIIYHTTEGSVDSRQKIVNKESCA